MTATQPGTTMTAHSVDLVDEDDARRMLFRLLEHVANTARTDTDEHLDEIRARDGEERHLGFARDRLGQQGLTGPGRTDHQNTARNTAAQALELTRIAQELDEFMNLFLGFITASDIGKGSLDLVFGKQACLALAEAHRAALASGAALHLPHEEHEHGNDHQNREARDQQLGPDALLFRLLALDNDVVVDQIADQAVVLDSRADGLERLAVVALTDNHEAVDRHTLDPTFLDLLDEVRVVQRLRLVRGGEIVHHRDQNGGDDQPQNQVFCHVVQNNYPLEQVRNTDPHDGRKPCRFNLLHNVTKLALRL